MTQLSCKTVEKGQPINETLQEWLYVEQKKAEGTIEHLEQNDKTPYGACVCCCYCNKVLGAGTTNTSYTPPKKQKKTEGAPRAWPR